MGMISYIKEEIQVIRERDPAIKSNMEVFLYPSFKAILRYRVAHKLYLKKHYFLARWVSQRAVRKTGIEIHPGATIDEEFFIDHGTGVVIGETAVIGKGCRLYQGVTLGALSFPKDGDGVLVKGVPRHPILEDNVTVYAGATILGRITIGSGSIIGGNVWVTKDVPAGTKLVQKLSAQPTEESLMGKA